MTVIEWGIIATLIGILVTIIVWIISDRRAAKFRRALLIFAGEEEEKKNIMLTILEQIRQSSPGQPKR